MSAWRTPAPPSPPPPSPAEATSRSPWLERARRIVGAVVVFGALTLGASVLLNRDSAPSTTEQWMFLEEISPADLGFITHGSSESGAWVLEPHELATGGRALANHEGQRGASPAVLVAKKPQARDLRLRTRCKVIADDDVVPAVVGGAAAPAACGVVFRFIDGRNHWIVRADLPANAIEVATVTGGTERVIGKSSLAGGRLAMGSWIDLGVEVRGDVVRVVLGQNLEPVLVAEAPLVPAAFGSAGLWAPSEARVFFDHLAIESLTPVPRSIEILPLLGRSRG